MGQSNKVRTMAISSLNGLKAIAMILIFWWHSPIKPENPDLGARMCELLFVLSGFLVGINHWNDTLEKKSQFTSDYWKSKLIKVWPLHLLAFLIEFVLAVVFSGTGIITKKYIVNAVINLSLLQAWSNDKYLYFSFNGATWFLSALLFCYLMAPTILNRLRRYKWEMMPYAGFVILRLSIEFLNFKWGWRGIEFNYHVSPIIRFLEFGIGLSLIPVYKKTKNKLQDKKYIFIVFSAFEIVTVFMYLYCMLTFNSDWLRGYYVLAVSVLILIMSFNWGGVCQVLSIKPLQLFSSIQLEFFIIHQVIVRFFQVCLPNAITSPLLLTILLFFVTLSLSVIYKKHIENKATYVLGRLLFNIEKAISK